MRLDFEAELSCGVDPLRLLVMKNGVKDKKKAVHVVAPDLSLVSSLIRTCVLSKLTK